MISIAASRALAGRDHVVPLLALSGRRDRRACRRAVGEEAHVVGVVGDHEEVERARRASPAGRSTPSTSSPRANRYASRGPSRAPNAPASIENDGVQVRVAEERPRRVVAARVGEYGFPLFVWVSACADSASTSIAAIRNAVVRNCIGPPEPRHLSEVVVEDARRAVQRRHPLCRLALEPRDGARASVFSSAAAYSGITAHSPTVARRDLDVELEPERASADRERLHRRDRRRGEHLRAGGRALHLGAVPLERT